MDNLALNYEQDDIEKNQTETKQSAPKSVSHRSQDDPFNRHDSLQRYLIEIKQYKLLSREEEVAIAHRARENDEEAINRLITSNLRLVVKIAMDFNRYWTLSLLDLIQEGNYGLLQAVRKYDPDRGVKFSYYASFWIKAYILKFIMDNSKLVKVGTTQSQRKLFFRLSKEKEKLKAEGIHPHPKLVAERLQVKEEEVIEMTQRLEGRELSINMPISDEYEEFFETFLKDPNLAVDEQVSEIQRRMFFLGKLKKFRKRLSRREADIFDNRIMAEKPIILQKLGKKHKISRERVRQIQQRIIENIKRWSKEEIPNFEEDYSDFIQ